jgi:hypothetical protein
MLLLALAGCAGQPAGTVGGTAALAAPSIAAAAPDAASTAAAPASVAPARAQAAEALALLATLAVHGKAPKTGYDRTGKFGTAWLDVDHNGCDTRNDILARDLTAETTAGPCRVLTGVLVDRYTGTTIHFVRGNTTSTLVQIDHRVALLAAWETGAQKLSQGQREALANDPLNLIAVDGRTNSAKGAGDAATWLPPLKSYRCAYVTSQIRVKARYRLWVAPAERDAMVRVLGSCGDAPAAAPPAPAVAPAVPASPIRPGSYCAPKGAIGVAASGTKYTCGQAGADSTGRYHWNA